MSNLLEQHIRIRLAHDILASANVIQGDTGRELYFVIDDYEVPDNAEYRIYLKKPSGKEIYNYCYYANGEIVVQLTTQMVAEIGQNVGQIQIVSSNHTLLTSFNFVLNVEENMIEGSEISSKDEFGILDELINNARIAINQVNDIVDTVTEQEGQREANEKERQSAEEERISAESLRTQEFTSMKNEYNTLKSNSETATTNANQATKNANTAADVANNAAELAQSKAQDAEKAATATNIATENATAATQAANDAAELAQSKAQDAQDAASTANNIAQEVQQKLSNGDFTASVDVGSVTTGEPGTSVSVTNSGTTKDAILDFVIPRGATGNIENIGTATIDFSEASTRENIKSGETIPVIFGKVQKWFSDLNTWYPRINKVECVDISNVFPYLSSTAGLTISGKLTNIQFGINLSSYTINLVTMQISLKTEGIAVPQNTSMGIIDSKYKSLFGNNGQITSPTIDLIYIDSYGKTEVGARIGVYLYRMDFYGIMYNIESTSGTKVYTGSATWVSV